jgi:hypothetical protein
MEPLEIITKLAVEQWRVLRMYERAVALGPPEQRAKHTAQLRYALSRLDAIAGEAGLRLVQYDGQPYVANLPVAVVNGDEFKRDESLEIEQTLEPTVLVGGEVRAMGKVVLRTAEPS